jgi:RNA polymerase sigma-70 factor (ECF subfamily)
MMKGQFVKVGLFQEEMVPHMDSLYTYALFLTSDHDQARDLLQETFLKAFRFLDRFVRGTNAKAWLYRIMRNTHINEFRRMKRQPATVEYDDEMSASQMLPAKLHGGAVDAAGTSPFDDQIAGAIASLPEKFKSVVILRDIEELPYEEIAEALEIPVGTVRSRLHRARSLLFEKLKEYARQRGYRIGETYAAGNPALAG